MSEGYVVEWRLNLAMGLVLAAVWTARAACSPAPLVRLDAQHASALARLEDDFAQAPSDRALAARLSRTYLEMDRPGLAVAVLRTVPAAALADPLLTHRLAEAYEASGRVPDAAATADLALARCDRSMGTAPPTALTPSPPEHACDLRLRAVLEMHRQALANMAAWGVTDPRHDPRARLAYDLALRRARVAFNW